ncbi:MAG TPA: serine/threonine-protein kinase [Pirellulaceae bacterium]|nr:serine/threonine-protein kinase [Pirellulaceae bacterium]
MEPGQTIAGRYRIDREIGRGNFGIVYLAEDERTGDLRAIKVLLPWAARNEQLRHRLRREARLAGSLTGEHAVKIHESGETQEGDVFLAMEYLQGEELTHVLQNRGPLPPARVQEIAQQVLAALDEAHRLGVIHRDLKPSNIFLCRDADGRDFVKVFDFGIAKVTGDGDLMATAKLTVSGGVMGTPVYMSPEQCRGEELTPASDFYSLGIVLYELLAGRVPFDDENPVRIMLMQNQDSVPPLPAAIAASPLGQAVRRSLAKQPGDRFATAGEFQAALRGEVTRPTPPPAAAEPRPERPAAQSAQPAKSAAWIWWVLAAALLLAAGGVLLFMAWR